MRVFKQLTLTDRIRIEKWLKDGLRVKEIADRLRVDPSTVYRELKRGSYDKLDGKTWKLIPTYSPDIAIRHIFGRRDQTLRLARIMSLQAISSRPL